MRGASTLPISAPTPPAAYTNPTPVAESPSSIGHVQHVHGQEHVAGEIDRSGAQGGRPQHRRREEGVQTLAHLAPEVALHRPLEVPGLVVSNPPDEPAGPQERDRVDQDYGRRRDPGNQRAGQCGAGHLRQRCAGVELAVGIGELRAIHQHRQDRDVGGIEDDRLGADQERDGNQEGNTHPVQHGGDRDPQQHGGPAEVGGDHQRLASEPVDPGPGDESEEQDRQAPGHRQQAHFERAGVQAKGRQQRNDDWRHLRADLGDRFGAPQIQEVAVAPKAGLREADAFEGKGGRRDKRRRAPAGEANHDIKLPEFGTATPKSPRRTTGTGGVSRVFPLFSCAVAGRPGLRTAVNQP